MPDEIFKQKKAQEIKMNREAEDVTHANFVQKRIGYNPERGVGNSTQTIRMAREPLLRREMERRKKIYVTEMDPLELDILMGDVEKVKKAADDLEKKWVSEKLEKLVKDTEEKNAAPQKQMDEQPAGAGEDLSFDQILEIVNWEEEQKKAFEFDNTEFKVEQKSDIPEPESAEEQERKKIMEEILGDLKKKEEEHKRQEQERLKAEEEARKEKERQEQEKLKTEEARKEKERQEQEKLKAEEEERKEKERQEQEKLKAEEEARKEKDRLEMERLDKELKKQKLLDEKMLEEQKLEEERIERERLEEEARLEKERQEEEDRKEQERLRLEEEKRLAEEAKKKAEEEKRKAEEEKKRRANLRKTEYAARVDLYAGDLWNIRRERKVMTHIPEKSALFSSFAGKFSNKLNDKKRAKKRNNVKSELYRKHNNYEQLKQSMNEYRDKIEPRYAEVLKNYPSDISDTDLRDLSTFMTNVKERNTLICKLFFGKKDEKGVAQVNESDAALAMVKMAEILINSDVSDFSFETDADIVANAKRLQKISDQVAAFDRLSEKYNFFDKLDGRRAQALNLKLASLRSISAYYLSRKELILDPHYSTHYNREMTMDVSTKNSKAEQELAKKLMRSYALGVNMMKVNNADATRIRKTGQPTFKNSLARNIFDDIVKGVTATKSNKMVKFVRESYTSGDDNASQLIDEIKHPAMRIIVDEEQEEQGKQDELDKSIIRIEDARAEKVKAQETGFADATLKKLLTTEELIPLRGTREYALVSNSIQALQAMLTNQMPPIKLDEDGNVDKGAETKAREEIDATCIAVSMMYNRLIGPIKALTDKYGAAYSEASAMLKELGEQCKKEGEAFKEKTLEFRKLAAADPEMRTRPLTWIDALRFNRGEYYDLDANKDFEVQKAGSRASEIMVIVPKNAGDPAQQEKEKVYFRKKDVVPPRDQNLIIDQAMEDVKLDEKIKEYFRVNLKRVFNTKGDVASNFFNKMTELNDQKVSNIEMGAIMYRALSQIVNKRVNLKNEDAEEVGRMFYSVRMIMAKSLMANRMSVSARIDEGRNLSDRNVATSRFATMLGVQDMIADSRTATVKLNGQLIQGNLMENAGGRHTACGAKYSSKAISQIFMLQVFDYICGQTDRHFNNFQGIVENGEIKSIIAIDNDMSFGNIKPEQLTGYYNRIKPLTVQGIMGLPLSFVNRLMAMDKTYMTQALGDILNAKEIDAAYARLSAVKEYIASLPGRVKDAVWDEETKTLSYKGYMADEQYRQYSALWKYEDQAARKNADVGNYSYFNNKALEASGGSWKLMKYRKRELDQNRKKK